MALQAPVGHKGLQDLQEHPVGLQGTQVPQARQGISAPLGGQAHWAQLGPQVQLVP